MYWTKKEVSFAIFSCGININIDSTLWEFNLKKLSWICMNKRCSATFQIKDMNKMNKKTVNVSILSSKFFFSFQTKLRLFNKWKWYEKTIHSVNLRYKPTRNNKFFMYSINTSLYKWNARKNLNNWFIFVNRIFEMMLSNVQQHHAEVSIILFFLSSLSKWFQNNIWAIYFLLLSYVLLNLLLIQLFYSLFFYIF